MRALLAIVLPYPGRFRASARRRLLGRPLRGRWCARCSRIGSRLRARCCALAPGALAAARSPMTGRRRSRRRRAARPRRDAHGCAQPVLDAVDQRSGDPAAHPPRRRGRAAEGRGLLRRARASHGPRARGARASRARNIDAWTREIDGGGLDAILVTASGCGTTIKDYGFMLRDDPAYAEKAARVSALAKDMTEYLAALDLARRRAPTRPDGRLSFGLLDAARPADHRRPEGAAARAGFKVKDMPEGHSAAARPAPTTSCSPRSPAQLRDRKVANIAATRAGRDRDRQYRLHHPACVRDHGTDRPHDRASGLGDRRPEAQRIGGTRE